MERTRQAAQEVCGLCQKMKDSQINLVREMMERIGGRWSLCVLYTLAVSGEPLRFLAISEKIKGISDKVLTQTLRSLEQDGLIIRHSSYSQVPPRVAYELTPLGRELVLATCPLWKWMSTCIAQFENARQTFATTKERASGQRVPSSTPTAMQLEMSFFD